MLSCHRGPDCTPVVGMVAGLRWLNERYLALKFYLSYESATTLFSSKKTA